MGTGAFCSRGAAGRSAHPIWGEFGAGAGGCGGGWDGGWEAARRLPPSTDRDLATTGRSIGFKTDRQAVLSEAYLTVKVANKVLRITLLQHSMIQT